MIQLFDHILKYEIECLAGHLNAQLHKCKKPNNYPSLYFRFDLDGFVFDATIETCIDHDAEDWGRFSFGITPKNKTCVRKKQLPEELKEICDRFHMSQNEERWYKYKYETLLNILKEYTRFIEEINNIPGIIQQ